MATARDSDSTDNQSREVDKDDVTCPEPELGMTDKTTTKPQSKLSSLVSRLFASRSQENNSKDFSQNPDKNDDENKSDRRSSLRKLFSTSHPSNTSSNIELETIDKANVYSQSVDPGPSTSGQNVGKSCLKKTNSDGSTTQSLPKVQGSSSFSGTDLKEVDSNESVCRICQLSETETASYLEITGCACRGSMAKCHTECLAEWIHLQMSCICEICHVAFAYNPEVSKKLNRKLRDMESEGCHSFIAYTNPQNPRQTRIRNNSEEDEAHMFNNWFTSSMCIIHRNIIWAPCTQNRRYFFVVLAAVLTFATMSAATLYGHSKVVHVGMNGTILNMKNNIVNRNIEDRYCLNMSLFFFATCLVLTFILNGIWLWAEYAMLTQL